MRYLALSLVFVVSFTLSKKYNEFYARKNNIINSFVVVDGASGFIIGHSDTDTFILTAYHVVKDMPIHLVYTSDNSLHSGKVVEFNEDLDYAIVKINHIHNYLVTCSNIYKPIDNVIAVGLPKSNLWISSGIISTITKENIKHTAGLYFGSSGGPLYNSDYEVIGMNVSMVSSHSESEPISFMFYAIKISSIIEDLGDKSTIYFGVTHES